MNAEELSKELFETEVKNMELYGYGIKAFSLSLIETAIRISDSQLPCSTINKIIDLGKEMLRKPVHLIDGIDNVLRKLKNRYKLIIATKGDLLDQERKLFKSGLSGYFHHIEIMSEKKENNYKSLLKHLDINANQFLMVGNSLKSDVIPVLELGGYAIYIPSDTTWQYEKIDDENIENERFIKLKNIREILGFLH
jgi:putative hydrolase of the HAD superfamily